MIEYRQVPLDGAGRDSCSLTIELFAFYLVECYIVQRVLTAFPVESGSVHLE